MKKTKPNEAGLEKLKMAIEETLGGEIELKVDKYDVAWVEVPSEKIRDVISKLFDLGYKHLTTITGTDLIDENKIEIIYHLAPVGTEGLPYLSIKTHISREDPKIATITDIFTVGIVYEREVYDLLGVHFEGHKNLSRILLPPDTPEGYHPLRKDFKGETE